MNTQELKAYIHQEINNIVRFNAGDTLYNILYNEIIKTMANEIREEIDNDIRRNRTTI